MAKRNPSTRPNLVLTGDNCSPLPPPCHWLASSRPERNATLKQMQPTPNSGSRQERE